MAFQSLEEAGAWAEANGGEQGLSAAIADGRFGADRRTLKCAKLWLTQREDERAAKMEADERELRMREIAAHEAAAAAAHRSARWAKWAFVAAAVSAVLASLAYVRPLH